MEQPQTNLSVYFGAEPLLYASPDILELMVTTGVSDGRSGFSLRLHLAALDAGLPEHGMAVAIARAMRVSPAAVGKWLSGKSMPDTKRLDALSKMLGRPAEWLLTGREIAPHMGDDKGNGSPLISALVPVTDFATLAVVGTDNPIAPAMMASSRVICPVEHGPRTFCIQMPDASMACDDSRAIFKGQWLHVDPDQTPADDQAVIARLEGGPLVVAQYQEQAGRSWLSLLNPKYPDLPSVQFSVLGRVVYVGSAR